MTPIIVGTNVFEGSDTPLAIDHANVVRVTTDEHGEPRISVDVAAPPARIPVRVESNVARSDGTVVDVDIPRHALVVRVLGHRVIEVRRIGGAIHLWLDFRPIGLTIHSDDNALYLGSSALSGNTIKTSGVGILLSTGEK